MDTILNLVITDVDKYVRVALKGQCHEKSF